MSVNALDDQSNSSLEKQVGENLAQARRASRFVTVQEVAEILNLSADTVSAIEQGNIKNYLNEIYSLICLYNCPTHHIFEGYFNSSQLQQVRASDIGDYQSYVVDVIGFHKKIRGDDLNLRKVLLRRGENSNKVPNVLNKTVTYAKRAPLKRLSLSTLQRRAKTLLDQHSLYQLPVNVYQVASNLGITVSFENFPNDFYMKLKGFCYKDEETSLIGINKSHPTVLQRFTLGHEIHHYLYDFSANRYLCGPENESIALEWNAEKFAAELLMPRGYVQKLISIPLNIRYLTITLVAQHFGVSYEAAAIRLAKFGLISNLKDACSKAYRKKDKQKTRYLINNQVQNLLAVFGLETGITELLSANNRLGVRHACGAYVIDPNHTVCWRCGLELQASSTDHLKNPFRQSSFNISPNTVASLEAHKTNYNQLSFNLDV